MRIASLGPTFADMAASGPEEWRLPVGDEVETVKSRVSHSRWVRAQLIAPSRLGNRRGKSGPEERSG